jgi:hypothetical protein
MVDVGSALIAYGETPEAIEPCEGAFDDPSIPTELFLALDALARNTREHAAFAVSVAVTGVIICSVGTALVWPSLRSAGLSANRRNSVEHVRKHRAAMDVSTCQPRGQWNTAPVCHKMPFRPRLAAIRWIWVRGKPPFFAGIDDESAQTRLKSILFAPRRRRSSSSSICSRHQPPANPAAAANR